VTLSMATAQALRGLLYEISPLDPETIGMVTGVFFSSRSSLAVCRVGPHRVSILLLRCEQIPK